MRLSPRDVVERSYPCVALYRVILRACAARGFNTLALQLELSDHRARHIARPNHDTLMARAALDLRDDAVVLDLPAIDSDYVSLETCGLDHSCEVPCSTRTGGFAAPQRLLLHTARTAGYRGERIRGIDRVVRLSSDLSMALCRVMPHAAEPVRRRRIVRQMRGIRLRTLSEFLGRPRRAPMSLAAPAPLGSEAAVFARSFAAVMRFVFAHVSLDRRVAVDRRLLALQPRIERGDFDGKALAAMARQVADEQRLRLAKASEVAHPRLDLFQPKSRMRPDLWLFQSVSGPMGLPASEALYAGVTTTDGLPMRASRDYVVHMNARELPPAKAFWSLTLYDTRRGHFVPNAQGRYSVGHNAGLRLDARGGIAIHVAARRPRGVPVENWLPIRRSRRTLDLTLRMYVPDLKRISTWKPPVACAC